MNGKGYHEPGDRFLERQALSMSEDVLRLSAARRIRLIKTLNALPTAQFEQLVFALAPPRGNIPSNLTAQAHRSSALLEWVESPMGPGLKRLEDILESLIQDISNTDQYSDTRAVEQVISVLREDTGMQSGSECKQNLKKSLLSGIFKTLSKYWKFINTNADGVSLIITLSTIIIGSTSAILVHAESIVKTSILIGIATLVVLSARYIWLWKVANVENEQSDRKTNLIYFRAALICIIILLGTIFLKWPRSDVSEGVTVLVADFDGPKQTEYKLNDTIKDTLGRYLAGFSDINIGFLGESISADDGSKIAREIGESHRADLLIWGWYTQLEEATPVSVNFEILKQPRDFRGLEQELRSQIQNFSNNDIESFQLQTEVAEGISDMALLTLGILRYEAEDWNEAISYFNEILKGEESILLKNNQYVVYIYRGLAYEAIQDYSQAIRDYTEAIGLESDDIWGHINRGFAYFKQRKLEEAISDYTQVIEKYPNSFVAYTKRSKAYSEQGNDSDAKEDIDKALRIEPEFSEAHFVQGSLFLKEGKLDESIGSYTKAIDLSPEWADPYFYRGNAYMRRGKLDPAQIEYIETINNNPNDRAKAYTKALMNYSFQADIDYAIHDYYKAIKYNSDFLGAYVNRAAAFGLHGEYKLAISDYSKAIDMQPDSPYFYADRARAYFDDKNYEKALEDFSRSIEISREEVFSYMIYINRSAVYNTIGQEKKAIEDLDRAVELRPEWFSPYYRRGLTYFKEEDYEKAINDLDKAIKIVPRYDAHFARALSYLYSGKEDKANQDLLKSLELVEDKSTEKLLKKEFEEHRETWHEYRRLDTEITNLDMAQSLEEVKVKQ